MTLQEIFNKVVLHLNKQEVKSVSDDGQCMYRGNNNTMCSVGCLIYDNVYINEYLEGTSIEGLPVHDPLVMNQLNLSGVFCATQVLDLLWELQRLHDNQNIQSFTSQLFFDKVKYVASEFELSIPDGIVIK